MEGPPRAVKAFAEAVGVAPLGPEPWRKLAELQRYVLLELSRDQDNVNLDPAHRESVTFGPVDTPAA